VEAAGLWWLLFWLGSAVFVVVLGLLLFSLFRRKPAAALPEPPLPGSQIEEGDNRWIVLSGIVVPAIILLVVYGFTLRSLAVLSTPEPAALTIDVTGHQWWWEVRYPGSADDPESDIVTANEIHIPVGQPVEVRLTSADVIHSFWVPQLSGKLDANPGDMNILHLKASTEGVYRGQCTEFCGIQHANMGFLVIAEPPELFEAWLEQQRQPAVEPANEETERGEQVFLNASCGYCHTIRGTEATGELGPDLTHLGSRRTLAAVTIENTRGHLGGWIVDSQSIKPGNKMPPQPLPAADLQALLVYLESLK
jgi:cytochrome c oxidase subunit 2